MGDLPHQELRRTPPRRLSDAELQARMAAAYPEALGPAVESESGAPCYGVGPERYITIGQPPLPLAPAIRDRDNREREQRWLALTPEQRAAQDGLREIIREEVRRA